MPMDSYTRLLSTFKICKLPDHYVINDPKCQKKNLHLVVVKNNKGNNDNDNDDNNW